jgi:hypothetical protein
VVRARAVAGALALVAVPGIFASPPLGSVPAPIDAIAVSAMASHGGEDDPGTVGGDAPGETRSDDAAGAVTRAAGGGDGSDDEDGASGAPDLSGWSGAERGVVDVYSRFPGAEGAGTGIVLGASGLIVTNLDSRCGS